MKTPELCGSRGGFSSNYTPPCFPEDGAFSSLHFCHRELWLEQGRGGQHGRGLFLSGVGHNTWDLTWHKLDQEVGEEQGKPWQEGGSEGVNLTPFWALLSGVGRAF